MGTVHCFECPSIEKSNSTNKSKNLEDHGLGCDKPCDEERNQKKRKVKC